MIVAKKIIFRKTPLDIPISLFLLSQIASTIFSIDIHTSLFGYYGRFNGGLISIIAYLILFYGFVSNMAGTIHELSLLLKTSLISSFLVILWGLPGKVGYDMSCWLFTGKLNNTCWTDQFRPAERMFSTLGQPNWLGAYLSINFFVGLYFLITNDKEDEKRSLIFSNPVLLFYLFLNFSVILFTRSRSALVSVILGLLLFVGYIVVKRKSIKDFLSLKKILAILCGLIFASIILFKTGIGQVDKFITLAQPPAKNFQKSAQTATQNKIVGDGVTESFNIRKIVWEGAVKLGLKYPLFGTGVETFAYSYYFVRPQEHNLTSEWDFLYNKAHNEYLNYLATTGFFGVGAYLFLITVVILNLFQNLNLRKQILKRVQDDSLLVLCLFLAYFTILITNFFGFSTTTINIFFFLTPAFIFVKEAQDQKKQSPEASVDKNAKILIAINILGLLYFLLAIVFYFVADVLYAQGDNYSKLGNFTSAVTPLKLADTLHYDHVYEDKLSFALANLAYLAAYQKQNDTVQKLVQESDAYNLQSIKASPQNVLYWKTRAKNYYLFFQLSLNPQDIQKGVEALNEAKKLSPTDPKIYYSLALYHSLLADEENDAVKKEQYKTVSMAEVDESIKLKPNFRDAYMVKAQLLKKYSQINEAKKMFRFMLDNFDPNDQEVKKEFQAL
jgi:O-antigen ligase